MSHVTKLAFEGRWAELLELLRESPEGINEASTGHSFTPLHQAAWHGANPAVIGELLMLGANRSLLNTNGQTAQQVALNRHPHRMDLVYLLRPRPFSLARLIRRLLVEQSSMFGSYDGNLVICDRLVEMFSLELADSSPAEAPQRVMIALRALTGLELESRQRHEFHIGTNLSFTTTAEFWLDCFMPALEGILQRPGSDALMAPWAVVSDLFDPVPEQWGLRGDPFLWLELRRTLSHTTLPATEDDLADILHGAYTAMTGSKLTPVDDHQVPYLARGGMSGGLVSGAFWCRKAIPMLQQRLDWLRQSWRF